MSYGARPPDRTILTKVNQRLIRTGMGASSHVTATVRSGDVTLSGTIQYEYQRRTILKAASGVEGVRQVVDLLQLDTKQKH